MNIRIIRGQDQIGGSIIEVSSARARIVLDVGAELDEAEPAAPPVEGLFSGAPAYDGVFITHYHGDHMGLSDQVLPGIPVYMGERAAAVNRASAAYLGRQPVRVDGFLRSGEPVTVGDIKVTPFLCDHSAFDSYMLLLECEGKRMLYTGDFRANGRKSFPALLKRLDRVDALITEGTTLSRNGTKTVTEAELEETAVRAMRGTDGPAFILMAATNIDRCVTAFRAAKRSGRAFLQDPYAAVVATAAGKNIPNPGSFQGVRVFQTCGSEKQHEILERFPEAKIGRAGIAREKFLMCVRPSMQGYLEKLGDMRSFEGGVLFYSMWSGYKRKEDVKTFLAFMESKGVSVLDLHTSGHAGPDTIRALIDDVDPRYIIPVHTENAAWFEKNTSRTVVREQSLALC